MKPTNIIRKLWARFKLGGKTETWVGGEEKRKALKDLNNNPALQNAVEDIQKDIARNEEMLRQQQVLAKADRDTAASLLDAASKLEKDAQNLETPVSGGGGAPGGSNGNSSNPPSGRETPGWWLPAAIAILIVLILALGAFLLASNGPTGPTTPPPAVASLPLLALVTFTPNPTLTPTAENTLTATVVPPTSTDTPVPTLVSILPTKKVSKGSCPSYSNISACQQNGCFWQNSTATCHNKANSCSAYKNPSACTTNGCNWDKGSSTCH